MRDPVLRHTHADEVIKTHRGSVHVVAHQVVIGLVFADLRSDFHHGGNHAFSPAVQHARLTRGRHVLLEAVNDDIGQTASDVIRRNGVRDFRIQNGEFRISTAECQLLTQGAVRDHGTVIHFGTRSRHRHDSGKRDLLFSCVTHNDIPRIFFRHGDTGCDQLRGVGDRTATDSQEHVNLFFKTELDGFTNGFNSRIGFNAPEFHRLVILQSGFHLVVDTIGLDATATERDHHLLVFTDQVSQTSDLTTTENELGGILKFKILHETFPLSNKSTESLYPCRMGVLEPILDSPNRFAKGAKEKAHGAFSMGRFLISIVVLPMTMTASGEVVILAMPLRSPLHSFR